MADAPNVPNNNSSDAGSKPNWADFFDEDIPVIDAAGKVMTLKGLDFVAPAAPAPAAPAPSAEPTTAPSVSVQPAAEPPTKLAPPPPNLPTLDENPPAPAVPMSPQPATSLGDLGLDPEADAAEIKKIEEKPAAKAADAEVKKELPLLESMVETAAKEAGVTLTGDDMQRRFKLLISLYFRDLRDTLETKSKFTMPVQSGGMGFDDATADRVMADLAKRDEAYHEALTGKAAGDKSAYVAKRTDAILNIQETTDRQEQEKGDQAFDGLMQRVGLRAENVEPPAPTPPRSIPVVGMESADAAPAAPSPVVVNAPAAPLPRPAPSSGAPSQRPLVTDVAYAPRLTGPVEEIRSLTLQDFRRLSRDANEAVLKIKDKIDLLDEQSFAMKSAAISAWQDCEVSRLYLDILRRSLAGVPVVEVIEALEKEGKPFLSKAEFDAVSALNTKLRFG